MVVYAINTNTQRRQPWTMPFVCCRFALPHRNRSRWSSRRVVWRVQLRSDNNCHRHTTHLRSQLRLETLECPPKNTHTNYVWKWNLCCVFLFPHFLILNLLWILFCTLLWASARAKRPHRTTFSCELRQHKCEEPKSNSTTKETK